MSREGRESSPGETVDQYNPEALLSGPLEPMIWHCLEHRPDVKLYAVAPVIAKEKKDSEDGKDGEESKERKEPELRLDRASGDGELRLSKERDVCIQIKIGNSWKVIDMLSLAEQSASVSRTVLSGQRLCLDAESLELVQQYKTEYQAAEKQNELTRAQARAARGYDAIPSVDKKGKKVESEFKAALRKYRLVEVDMYARNAAAKLVDRIFKPDKNPSAIDINSEDGQRVFCAEWRSHCGEKLPLPFVPPQAILKRFFPSIKFPRLVDPAAGSLDYVNFLLKRNVVSNLTEKGTGNQVSLPRYESGVNIYAIDWEEADHTRTDLYGTPVLESTAASPLLEFFGIKGVLATRKEIDEALWEGDPGDREPSQKHEEFLANMGLVPEEWTLRLIDYGEYARVAEKKGWGMTNLRTHFDGYVRDEDDNDKKRYGLCGGNVDLGGASHVYLSNPNQKLAVRLILERRKSR